jgi:hypothetical protein
MTDTTRDLDQLLLSLRTEIESNRRVVDKFVQDLTESGDNPLHCFEWSRHVFQAAAKVSVYSRWMGALERIREVPENTDDVAFLVFLGRLVDYIVQGAAHPKSSTSAPSNYAAQCDLEALAALHSDIQYF